MRWWWLALIAAACGGLATRSAVSQPTPRSGSPSPPRQGVPLPRVEQPAPSAASPLPKPAELPDPIVTRQTVFAIPFQVGAAKASDQPAEVLLHVSADHGLSWQTAAKAKPRDGSFSFRAPRDSEYWFAISTLARQPKPPAAPYKTELRVIVDTTPPKLDLVALRGASGEVTAHWHATDTNLNPDSLRLECQSAPSEPWETMATEPPATTTPGTLTGEGIWWPKPSGGVVLVRGRVADRAGNPAVVQVQVKPLSQPFAVGDAATSPVAQPPSPGYEFAAKANQPTASQPQPSPELSAPSEPSGPSPSLPILPTHDVARPMEIPNNAPPRPPIETQAWPADVARDPFTRRPWPEMKPPADEGGPTEPPWRAADAPRTNPPGNLPIVTYPPGRTPAQPVGRQLLTDQRQLDLSLLPAGVRPRFVNSTTFELDYEVDGTGSTGIARVELWATRDGGRTWTSLGTDPDARSPATVRVEGEGLYGLSIVFLTGAGLGGTPPRSGDRPELWIAVDLTRPVARITSAEPGRDVGDLVIRWEAADGQPDPRPISLWHSDRPGGPWTPIVSGLENSGSYTWRIDNRVPERFYLRLEARDEAGNVGVYETPDPVSFERQRPQGRILGVRPIGGGASR